MNIVGNVKQGMLVKADQGAEQVMVRYRVLAGLKLLECKIIESFFEE